MQVIDVDDHDLALAGRAGAVDAVVSMPQLLESTHILHRGNLLHRKHVAGVDHKLHIAGIGAQARQWTLGGRCTHEIDLSRATF